MSNAGAAAVGVVLECKRIKAIADKTIRFVDLFAVSIFTPLL
jgi:hypothetical protein